MNHVSVIAADRNGPTQGQTKTLTRVGIEPTTFGLLYRLSYKVRREQAVGTDDVKATAMNFWLSCLSSEKGLLVLTCGM